MFALSGKELIYVFICYSHCHAVAKWYIFQSIKIIINAKIYCFRWSTTHILF